MNLVVVTTGDVASEEIKQDMLGGKEIGKTIVIEFVQVRLIKKEVKFHDSKDKTVANKANRDLLR